MVLNLNLNLRRSLIFWSVTCITSNVEFESRPNRWLTWRFLLQVFIRFCFKPSSNNPTEPCAVHFPRESVRWGFDGRLNMDQTNDHQNWVHNSPRIFDNRKIWGQDSTGKIPTSSPWPCQNKMNAMSSHGRHCTWKEKRSYLPTAPLLVCLFWGWYWWRPWSIELRSRRKWKLEENRD